MARNEASLKDVSKELDTTMGQQHSYLLADFSKPDEVKNIIEQYVKDHVVFIF